MSWTDQNPEATDVLLNARAITKSGEKVWFEVGKVTTSSAKAIWNGFFRVTVGNLFGSQEVCRRVTLEGALRQFAESLSRN